MKARVRIVEDLSPNNPIPRLSLTQTMLFRHPQGDYSRNRPGMWRAWLMVVAENA
jgi:hypothetical protein